MEAIVDGVAQLAADQGIANVISLALIWVIFNMQRAQGAETKQQNKLITQLGLTISKIGNLSGSVDQLGNNVRNLIDASKEDTEANNKVIADGVQVIADNTESVRDMKDKLEELQKQMETLLKAIAGGVKMADEDKAAIEGKLDTLSTSLQDVLSKLDSLQKNETEKPTEAIPAINIYNNKPQDEIPVVLKSRTVETDKKEEETK